MSASGGAVRASEEYHLLILEGLRMQQRGWAARRETARALRAQGMTPPKIAEELARRALAAGCTPQEVRRLGISEHNVRLMLREHVEA